ncbi:hypothetical protein AYL99_02086 [Fonsecaea erecta]|uniref:Uncharacterized protein n=1 Tax=Fonsecaea erecta TaxID=1367422 RepID=A0A178ZST0_9EURO|nr:hypothetical protein AYL99_02086 [Fonsecaea erecta]OAP62859.1 hypothetical protein AYL99_02086 [Fonsecaea erecta]
MSGWARQLLFSHDGSRLLITTATEYVFWDLRANRKSSSGSNLEQQWVTLGHSLGLITAQHSLQLYDWEAQRQGAALLPDISSTVVASPTGSLVHKVLPQDSGSNIVACTLPHADGSKINIIGWYVPSTCSSGVAAHNARHFSVELPARYIKTFIGLCADLVIFLDHELWICSVSVQGLKKDGQPRIKQHFFIPPDLVNGAEGLKAMITKQGHVAFAKGIELAIVKRGLIMDYTP